MDVTVIAVASDHGGFEQKQRICAWLAEQGYIVDDRGSDDAGESVDYPDYARSVSEEVAGGRAHAGVLVCGTGIGMSIAANKIDGIRAANVTSPDFAVLAREHNDANVIALSGRFVDFETNLSILEKFLKTPFAGGRHARRVEKIMSIERER